MSSVKRRRRQGVWTLIGLYTWCGRHGVIVRPGPRQPGDGLMVMFGSDADFCSHKGCERPVIKSKPIYERVEP
jgi:hypothetical protein